MTWLLRSKQLSIANIYCNYHSTKYILFSISVFTILLQAVNLNNGCFIYVSVDIWLNITLKKYSSKALLINKLNSTVLPCTKASPEKNYSSSLFFSRSEEAFNRAVASSYVTGSTRFRVTLSLNPNMKLRVLLTKLDALRIKNVRNIYHESKFSTIRNNIHCIFIDIFLLILMEYSHRYTNKALNTSRGGRLGT